MPSPNGGSEPGCSRKRPRYLRDVELIDLDDHQEETEMEQNQPGTFNDEETPFPAWAKKRTNMWVKDATDLLGLEPTNGDADDDFDLASNPPDVDEQTHHESGPRDEFCVNIPLQRMLHSYAEYRETSVICYLKSGALNDAEMEQWMASDDASRLAVEHVWPLGQGFFAIKFTSKSAAAKVLLSGEMPLNEGLVYVVPYIPSFFPTEDVLKKTWPVWVSFPRLPLFLVPFLSKIASVLGKVLHVSQPSCVIRSVLPRVCILWDARKKAPDNVKVSFDQLGMMKLAVEFDRMGAPAGASDWYANGEERGGAIEPLPLLLPAPASNDKEPLPSMQRGVSPACVPAPFAPEPAIVNSPKEIRGPIVTSPISKLQCPRFTTAFPVHVNRSISRSLLKGKDEYEVQGSATEFFGREARTTYDNALYQHKKSKSSGKELAIAVPRPHVMKEVSSNSKVTHMSTGSKKKYVYSFAGKENTGSRKEPKCDKENSVVRKDPKLDKGNSTMRKDPKSDCGHTVQNSTFCRSPERITSSPKPYYLSPMSFGTPPTS